MPNEKTLRVAQYLRVSTDKQEFSLVNQAAAIASYAVEHGMVIVNTYVDEARSGLSLQDRKGLKQLLHDVVAEGLSIHAVLAYDVSRFGRFQDIDEAAHYEFICKSAGAPVIYCSETFGADNSLPNMIMKSLKRVMAGEYSRELSVKSYHGILRVAERGFSPGGMAPYGFRRMMVSPDRTPKGLLRKGDRKALQTDRVILVHGPQQELDTVREIYRLFIDAGFNVKKIANDLNQRGIPLGERQWYPKAVHSVLTSPKYCGYEVWGMSSQKLRGKEVAIPKSEWHLFPGVIEPIVDPKTYRMAQQVIASQTNNKTDDALLLELRNAIAKMGSRVSAETLERLPNLPSINTYSRRFGSLRAAYERVGFDYGNKFVPIDRRIRAIARCSLISGRVMCMRRWSVRLTYSAISV
jgi:DNA invertase Pin-like site-specific DNA recombinase